MKQIKKKAARWILRMIYAVSIAMGTVLMESTSVFASGQGGGTGGGNGGVTLQGGDGTDLVSTVTGPMMTLIKAILSVMSVVGVLMLVKAIMDLVNAIQDQSPSGMYHAGRSIAVALIMTAIYPVVSLFVNLG